MKSFTYERAGSPTEAAASAARTPGAKFIAGGTNLLDLMKLEIETPMHLIDVNGLKLDTIEATGEGGLRKQANFHKSSMMMLDFDNGGLSIEDFIRFFWIQSGRGNKRSFIIFNSFSRSPEQPNRYRVCLMYKSPATSLEAHQSVYDSVVCRLEQYGYTEESAQLDRQCRTGNQSFYMPATNAAQPDWHYFNAFGCTTRGIERHGIVPDHYLRTSLISVPEKATVVNIANPLKDEPRKSIDEWKLEISGMSEGRRKILFKFGWAMATQFKLSRTQVFEHLQDVALGDDVLSANIDGVMISLNKKRLLARSSINSSSSLMIDCA